MIKRRSLALSRKILLTICNKSYPSLMLNDAKVQFTTNQKHLVFILDSRLDFVEHIDNKSIGMIKRRSLALPRKISLKIYNKSYPSLMLNDARVQFATSQKYLVLILDFRLEFIEHIDNKINKYSKIIGMRKKGSLMMSRKILLIIYNKNYSSLMLNDAKVQFATSQKHFVLILDSRLDFIEHIDDKITKCNKIIGMIKRRSLALSRKILLTIYNKSYPSFMLNDTKVQFTTNQKHLA